MLKILNYLSYKGFYYLCVQRKTNTSYRRLWPLWEFLEVSQSCKMLQLASNDAVASLLYAGMFELYLVIIFYTNVRNLH